ncbi:hypothetical protein Tco_0599910 [Tanacetum coccineum]
MLLEEAFENCSKQFMDVAFEGTSCKHLNNPTAFAEGLSASTPRKILIADENFDAKCRVLNVVRGGKLPLRVSLKRLHVEALTLAALAGVAIVEYRDHKTGAKSERRKSLKNFKSKEHLKSKVVLFVNVSKIFKCKLRTEDIVNKSLNLSVEELYKARALAEATLRERDELIFAQCEKIRLLEEQYEKYFALKETKSLKVEIKSLQTENKVQKSKETELINLEKVYGVKEFELLEKIEQMKSQVSELLEKLKISDHEMKQQIILFEEDKRIFLAKNEFLEKVSSSVQKEYNDLLASNDVLKQRLETKFKFLQHDTSLEKMFEMIEKEYESNVSKISMSSSTFESKNLKLVNEMGDKVNCFDEEKKMFATKISKLKKDLTQRVKDFDDVKTELSKRTDKFETYFANLEKKNALLKSQLASQNYTSLQKENNDLRTSYNLLKEKYEFFVENLEKENNDLKMHYKRLFDSIKQKKAVSQVFTKSIPKVKVSKKIYMGKSSKPISKKVSQFTTYSLQKYRKNLKKQHSSETFAFQNHVKNESSKQMWKSKENISKRFKYSRDEMFSMRKRDDLVLKKVKDVVISDCKVEREKYGAEDYHTDSNNDEDEVESDGDDDVEEEYDSNLDTTNFEDKEDVNGNDSDSAGDDDGDNDNEIDENDDDGMDTIIEDTNHADMDTIIEDINHRSPPLGTHNRSDVPLSNEINGKKLSIASPVLSQRETG